MRQFGIMNKNQGRQEGRSPKTQACCRTGIRHLRPPASTNSRQAKPDSHPPMKLSSGSQFTPGTLLFRIRLEYLSFVLVSPALKSFSTSLHAKHLPLTYSGLHYTQETQNSNPFNPWTTKMRHAVLTEAPPNTKPSALPCSSSLLRFHICLPVSRGRYGGPNGCYASSPFSSASLFCPHDRGGAWVGRNGTRTA